MNLFLYDMRIKSCCVFHIRLCRALFTFTQDWLIDWLVGWLIDWLVGWLTDWLIDWLSDSHVIVCVIGLIDWLTDWLIGWLVDWLIDCLILMLLYVWLEVKLIGECAACVNCDSTLTEVRYISVESIYYYSSFKVFCLLAFVKSVVPCVTYIHILAINSFSESTSVYNVQIWTLSHSDWLRTKGEMLYYKLWIFVW